MRESKSVDFAREAPDADVIYALAGSPSIMAGASSPGMLTPRELTAGYESSPTASLGVAGYEKEANPFGEFSSVTRDVRGW